MGANVKRLIDFTAIMALCGIVAVIFYQVIARYVLNVSVPWATEVPRYLFIWLVLLGSITALIDEQHFAVDFLADNLGARSSLLLRIVGDVVMVAVLYVLVFYGWQLTGRVSGQLSSALRIPMSYVYAAVPVASLFMLLFVVWDAIKSVTKLVTQQTSPTNEPGAKG